MVHQRPQPAGGSLSSTETQKQRIPQTRPGEAGTCLLPHTGLPSVPRHLRGLAIRALVGGLDEHGLRDVLACRHGHLLDLVELLADRRRGREVSSHAAPLWARSLSSSQACVKSVPGTRP